MRVHTALGTAPRAKLDTGRPRPATSPRRPDPPAEAKVECHPRTLECQTLKMREPVRRRFVTDLPGFRRLLIRQVGVSSHREISGNKNSYIAEPYNSRATGSESCEDTAGYRNANSGRTVIDLRRVNSGAARAPAERPGRWGLTRGRVPRPRSAPRVAPRDSDIVGTCHIHIGAARDGDFRRGTVTSRGRAGRVPRRGGREPVSRIMII